MRRAAAVLLPLGLAVAARAGSPAQLDAFVSGLGFPPEGPQARLLSRAGEYWFRESDTRIPLSELGRVDAVMAFAFGQTPDGEAGPTNRGLAAVVARLRRLTRGRVPVLAQWEIDDELQALGEAPAAYRAVVRGGYLSTLGVMDQFEEYAREEGLRLDRVLLVAQEDHGFRVRLLLARRGVEGLLGPGTTTPPGGWSRYGCAARGYWAGSSQEWTRTRARFLLSDMSTLLRALADGHVRSEYTSAP